MRDELWHSLWRYEAMTGLVDWTSEEEPGREDRDRAAFGREYGLVRYPDGQDYLCFARVVRFLVEVCGHAYEESLDALVEYFRQQPHTHGPAMDIAAVSKGVREGAPNIIEALFALKVDRLISRDDPKAVDLNWRVTRTVIGLRGQPRLP